MNRITFRFANPETAQLIETWGNDNDLGAIAQLEVHLIELFNAQDYLILSAEDFGETLWLKLAMEEWPTPREFGLMAGGSLTW